jgi:hypothetical protein
LIRIEKLKSCPKVWRLGTLSGASAVLARIGIALMKFAKSYLSASRRKRRVNTLVYRGTGSAFTTVKAMPTLRKSALRVTQAAGTGKAFLAA